MTRIPPIFNAGLRAARVWRIVAVGLILGVASATTGCGRPTPNAGSSGEDGGDALVPVLDLGITQPNDLHAVEARWEPLDPGAAGRGKAVAWRQTRTACGREVDETEPAAPAQMLPLAIHTGNRTGPRVVYAQVQDASGRGIGCEVAVTWQITDRRPILEFERLALKPGERARVGVSRSTGSAGWEMTGVAVDHPGLTARFDAEGSVLLVARASDGEPTERGQTAEVHLAYANDLGSHAALLRVAAP